MKRSSGIVLATLTAILVAGCGTERGAPRTKNPNASSPAESVQQTPDEFWHEFRTAVMADNRLLVLSKVRFPFTIRRPDDENPVASYDRPTFWTVYLQIMQQDVGLYARPQPVRDYIRRNMELPPVPIGGGKTVPVAGNAKEFHVGPLNFKKMGEQWYWVSAFEEFQD